MKTGIKIPFVVSVLITGLGLTLAGRVSAQTFATLHSFTGSDGEAPFAGLITNSSGNTLYGTTHGGGRAGNGTVFAVHTDGTGFTILHNFVGGFSDGANPFAGLILSSNTLYGTTHDGVGSRGYGTVFAVHTDGTGFTNLHNFAGVSDGAIPVAGLLLSGNTLYGTAGSGGSGVGGTVFALHTDGTGFRNLHNFAGVSDGANPQAGLILSGNTLYGTASAGGGSVVGTVFAVSTDGTGFTNLHVFSAGSTNSLGAGTNSDGAFPVAGLLLSGSTLYGTASGGGNSGVGTVFAVSTDGTSFTTLHNFTATYTNSFGVFTNSDGATPYAGLLLSGNTLYGTASGGGNSGGGTVFAVNTNGTGFTNLHNFAGFSDGANPFGGLLLSGNTLYGTAPGGGRGNGGTVFSLSLGLSPPTVFCSPPLTLECSNSEAVGTIQAEVQDTNGNPLQVVWTVDGTASQTNNIPSGGTITASNVTFTANFELGGHVVVVSASNGQTDPITCSTTVTVRDTTPPQIMRIVANPNVLWPSNHRMVPVNLMVEAIDNCDPSPVSKIINVRSNEPENPSAPDWEITGARSLNLRAERLGKGRGRVYTIVVQCKDLSGNVSTASVDVTVPHD